MDRTSAPAPEPPPPHVLQNAIFRRSWLASLASNLGIQIMAATAAWSMMVATDDPERVAMVQTALILPILLFGFLSGSIVDIFDKRRIVLIGSAIMAASCLCAWLGHQLGLMPPFALLTICFILGSGHALLFPAWQTAIREQIPRQLLPQAISLNSISFNIGRSAGPALGGLLIAMTSMATGFAVPFFSMLPIIAVFWFWPSDGKHHPYKERLTDAVDSGFRYIINSPVILNCQFRGLMVSCCTSVMVALAPFVARDVLSAGASAYGGLLGAFGLGAVAGAILINQLHSRVGPGTVLRSLLAIGALGCGIVGLSSAPALSMAGFFLTGLAHMASITFLNVIVQLHSAQWAAARVLSSFYSFAAGGLAISSAVWGILAADLSTAIVMDIAAAAFIASIALTFFLPVSLPSKMAADPADPLPLRWPDDMLAPEDGPLIVEILFSIDEADEADFLAHMASLSKAQARIGFRDWSLTRSVSHPNEWCVRYSVKSWETYLNQRTRMTAADREIIEVVNSLHRGPLPVPLDISLAVRPAVSPAPK